ncbi:MAG: ribonuclease HII [Bdellovibrionia bacterium]
MKNSKEFTPIDWKQFSPSPVIGVDEVGRGCLAGPVYAAAVILTDDDLSGELTDSKLLSEKRRDHYSQLIHDKYQVSIAFATAKEIDELNILNAALLAMKRAVEGLNVSKGHVLVDGNKVIPGLAAHYKQTPIVKGDLRVAPISAASIAAKVARDRIMKELSERFPYYGFEVHKGYSTAAHKKSIEAHGPCFEHRQTFAGVKEHLHKGIIS